MYGENGGGNPPIFQFCFYLFALFFVRLHKGTPHYTTRGDQHEPRSEELERVLAVAERAARRAGELILQYGAFSFVRGIVSFKGRTLVLFALFQPKSKQKRAS